MPRPAIRRDSPAKARGIKIAIIREAKGNLSGDVSKNISRAMVKVIPPTKQR